MRRVGIDDIAIYIPPLYLDFKDFAKARDLDPAKLEYGLGIKKMAMVDSDQDPACMAANACLRLLEKNNLEPNDIGRIYLATESAVDESKAMNSYVIGMLEQVYGEGAFEHCGGIECKFACVSGSYALYDNTNWIRAMENDDKAAIVIVSDVAKYDMGSSGEYTQGAGAIAMLIKENPRIIAFDPKVTSAVIKNEYDFYRPFARKTPVVNGQYSNLAYLIQVKKALMEYERKALQTGLIKLEEGECVLDHIDLIAVHLPYAKMGKNALAYLLRHEWRDLPRWKEVIELIGMEEPKPKDNIGTIEAILQDKEFMEKDKEFNKRFMKTPQYQQEFINKLESSLKASSLVGNLYTGSLYMGFRSELEYEYKKGRDLAGLRVGFASYGSGASAMVFSGLIQDEYEEVVKKFDLEREMGERRKLSIEEYVDLHADKRNVDQPIISNKRNQFVLVRIGRDKKKEGFREYIFVN
ncbi:MAG: 3-hydroxy-3-methylglutaryl-CoA synthase [Candidatus Nitrosothermus koennekii]|nr:MAG: 3-hydroxy-3-methylglutaryl-CoA synthase [Candidatus Nitrosothermus koennekii]